MKESIVIELYLKKNVSEETVNADNMKKFKMYDSKESLRDGATRGRNFPSLYK